MLDADAAWKAASDVQNLMGSGCAAVVVKHGNPCGMVHASSAKLALEKAWAGDSVSAFGGIIALTQKVDADIAKFFNEKFIEILMAPGFTAEAIQVLATKKNVRVLELPVLSADKKSVLELFSEKSEDGGFVDPIVQIVSLDNTYFELDYGQVNSK